MKVKIILAYDDKTLGESGKPKRMPIGEIIEVGNKRGRELINAKVAEEYKEEPGKTPEGHEEEKREEPSGFTGFENYGKKDGERFGKRTNNRQSQDN